MSAPEAAAGGMRAVGIYRRMTWTRLKRGRLRWAVLALLALPVLGTAILALTGKWGRDLFDNIMEVHLRFLVLFLPALVTSSSVAEEIEGRTFTFVFARPSPRWALPIGKYIAAIVPLVGLFAVSVVLSYVIALLVPPAGPSELVENLPILGRSVLAVSLGVITFGAIAAVLGSWFTRHPFIAVMGYLLLVEGLLASLPLIVSVVAMSWHLRNVGGITAGSANWDSVFAEAHLSPWTSAGILVAVSILALFGAATSVGGAEYRTDR